jgi:hypothetical protein
MGISTRRSEIAVRKERKPKQCKVANADRQPGKGNVRGNGVAVVDKK